jgi:hypothetical protein
VSARGGASTFARARWGISWRGEGVPHLLERDGGCDGEGREFHICSSEMGDVMARGGASMFARARWGRCRRGEDLPRLLERDGGFCGEGREFFFSSKCDDRCLSV